MRKKAKTAATKEQRSLLKSYGISKIQERVPSNAETYTWLPCFTSTVEMPDGEHGHIIFMRWTKRRWAMIRVFHACLYHPTIGILLHTTTGQTIEAARGHILEKVKEFMENPESYQETITMEIKRMNGRMALTGTKHVPPRFTEYKRRQETLESNAVRI